MIKMLLMYHVGRSPLVTCVWNGKEAWSVTTWMGVTWKTQSSAPTDAHMAVFTLMSLADSDTRPH